MFKKLFLQIRKLLSQHATKKDIAGGFAIGTFLALTPTMGGQSIIALVFARLFKKNELAALIAVWITNPLTFIPIYYLNYKLGVWILPESFSKMPIESFKEIFSSFDQLLAVGGQILIPLWLGSLIVACFFTVLGYYFALWFYPKAKAAFESRRQKRDGEKTSNQ